jgi:hypothetical protein
MPADPVIHTGIVTGERPQLGPPQTETGVMELVWAVPHQGAGPVSMEPKGMFRSA